MKEQNQSLSVSRFVGHSRFSPVITNVYIPNIGGRNGSLRVASHYRLQAYIYPCVSRPQLGRYSRVKPARMEHSKRKMMVIDKRKVIYEEEADEDVEGGGSFQGSFQSWMSKARGRYSKSATFFTGSLSHYDRNPIPPNTLRHSCLWGVG